MISEYNTVNGELIKISAEEISARQAEEEQASKNFEKILKEAPYINQRKNAYPEIGDQLDMLWHSIDQNAELKQKYFNFYEAIKQVKVKYPKNG